MNKRWRFPPLSGGQREGFNNSAMDHFKGHRLSSMVREVIQNSLDADKVSKKLPAKVHFEVLRVKDENGELSGIKDNLKSCLKTATKQKYDKAKEFYKDAIKIIDKEESVPVLAIHDYNTKGLYGDIGEDTGPWNALVRGTGITDGKKDGLGSYGHGSKAPFTLSNTRSILYLTYIKSGNSLEKRFQGKSTLQSHRDPKTSKDTQATGLFGNASDDDCSPLINDEIPSWATSAREKVAGLGTGTTIYIPYYQLGLSEEPETVISIISNFYYAIFDGHLEVVVGNEAILNKANIRDDYYEYKNRIPYEHDHIDRNTVEENFESLECLISPDDKGVTEVSGYDRFEWYIRYKDEELSSQKVALARNTGMLITHNPHKLERFPGTTSFNMFVCAKGKLSNVIKSAENPAHNAIEFDRIEKEDDRKKNIRTYEAFTKKVRDIVKRFAKLDSDESILDNSLNDIFDDGLETPDKDSIDRGNEYILSRQNLTRKPNPKPHPGPGVGPDEDLHPAGPENGDPVIDPNPNPLPPSPVIPDEDAQERIPLPQDAHKSIQKSLENLRIILDKDGSSKFKAIFDNPGVGRHELNLSYLNESGGSMGPVPIRAADMEGTYANGLSFSINPSDSTRVAIKLEARDGILDYALAGFTKTTVEEQENEQ